jgi:hypothetical protein
MELSGKAGRLKGTEMTQSQKLYEKMIDRRTAKGWSKEDSKYDLFRILTDTSSTAQKIRDLVYFDFATEKQATTYLAQGVEA